MANPGPLPFLGTKSNTLRALELMRLDEKMDKIDVPKAERASRLHLLFQAEVWVKDILPILHTLYDDYLEQVKLKTMDPDALKPLDDLIQRLGGDLQLGIGAMTRIAQRRLAAAEKIERQQSDSPN